MLELSGVGIGGVFLSGVRIDSCLLRDGTDDRSWLFIQRIPESWNVGLRGLVLGLLILTLRAGG